MSPGRPVAVVTALVAVLAVAACGPFRPGVSPTDGATTSPGAPQVVATVADHLRSPWGMARLPDGSTLVTQRDDGTVLRIAPEGGQTQVGTVQGVVHEGEGGLLGIVVVPDTQPQEVLVYYTAASDNRIARLLWEGGRLTDQTVIFSGIPRGPIHDGGRMVIGPDGHLYVGTGETGQRELAQDPDSLGGKILRLTTAGRPAPGNPIPGSPVWSLGHRNVQGLAFDGDRLWASEFGQDDVDELNLIEKGGNYGWPLCEGACQRSGMTDPVVQWSPTAIASPSGMAIQDGSAWIAALRGQTLYQVRLDGDHAAEPVAWLDGAFGRLRDVMAAADGTVWVMTDNTDGRGRPGPEDDRILSVRVLQR